MDRKTVLQMAEKCVCTDRNQQYGEPEDNFDGIAEFWTTYIKNRCVGTGASVEVTSGDVSNMMMLFKIARAMTATEQKADTYIDIAGYAACAAEILTPNTKEKE